MIVQHRACDLLPMAKKLNITNQIWLCPHFGMLFLEKENHGWGGGLKFVVV